MRFGVCTGSQLNLHNVQTVRTYASGAYRSCSCLPVWHGNGNRWSVQPRRTQIVEHFPIWTPLLGCTALHCTALHCTALHCTAPHRTAPHRTAPHRTALHCTALHCPALHCTALHCTTSHHINSKEKRPRPATCQLGIQAPTSVYSLLQKSPPINSFQRRCIILVLKAGRHFWQNF